MDPEIRQLPQAERAALIEGLIAVEEERLGLNQPFIIRSFRFLVNAMTLNLGRAEQLTSDSGSKEVRRIILERLPHTLVLFATANIVLFFTALFVGLVLSRQYGSWLDKMVISLAPSSAVPGWFYGIFLILIFAALLGWLPFGGAVKAPPPESSFEYALSLLRHMLLPATAVIISAVFILIYDWRTFFLIFSSEDYVEMAKAKGLSSRQIERRYILRPTLAHHYHPLPLACDWFVDGRYYPGNGL
jgi:peptide/nickel transport system permease protein